MSRVKRVFTTQDLAHIPEFSTYYIICHFFKDFSESFTWMPSNFKSLRFIFLVPAVHTRTVQEDAMWCSGGFFQIKSSASCLLESRVPYCPSHLIWNLSSLSHLPLEGSHKSQTWSTAIMDCRQPLNGARTKCHNNNCNNLGLNHCGACKVVYYCSSSCQRENWKLHKKNCGKNYDPIKCMDAFVEESIHRSIALETECKAEEAIDLLKSALVTVSRAIERWIDSSTKASMHLIGS